MSRATFRPRPRVGAGLAALAAASALALLGACAPTVRAVQERTGGVLVPTAWSNRSVIFFAPVDGGVILIDLGWMDAEAELSSALDRRGFKPDDVVAVLLTHAHRDHIAAWPLVADAPFYMAAREVDLFFGRAPPGGTLARLGHRLKLAPRPDPGDVEIRTFSGDTALAFGRDTLRVFPVRGHTAGSAAYLFRGVLFIGDALAGAPFGGLGPASAVYSDDRNQARRSIDALWSRLELFEVRFLCTAHGRCVSYEEAR